MSLRHYHNQSLAERDRYHLCCFHKAAELEAHSDTERYLVVHCCTEELEHRDRNCIVGLDMDWRYTKHFEAVHTALGSSAYWGHMDQALAVRRRMDFEVVRIEEVLADNLPAVHYRMVDWLVVHIEVVAVDMGDTELAQVDHTGCKAEGHCIEVQCRSHCFGEDHTAEDLVGNCWVVQRGRN
jgi:hypothetical protein